MIGDPSNYISINGISYNVVQPTDGIALSHDTKTLYYADLSRTSLWSIPTSLLQDFDNEDSYISEHVQLLGDKGYCDGMAFSSDGNLYFGITESNAVGYWNVSASPNAVTTNILVTNNATMQWPDTFAFDENNLLFTASKLQLWWSGTMKFDGSDGPNYRIWSVPIDGGSYLTGNPVPPSMTCRVAGH